MLILLQYIKWMKILCWNCFLNIKTGIFKRICVWVTQNFQLQLKQWLLCAFWVYCQRNTAWWCGVLCLRVAFINISALKCSVYSWAGFNWRNMEYVKYLHANSVVPEIKYWQWGDIGETFTIQTVYFVVAKIKFLWITNHSHYEFHIKSQ